MISKIEVLVSLTQTKKIAKKIPSIQNDSNRVHGAYSM